MITADTLKADGFKEFQIPPASENHRLADRFFQKCIRSDDGRTKLYHVNVYLYDWRRFDRPGPPESMMFEVWCYIDGERDSHCKLDLSPASGVPLANVLAYLHRAWEALSGIPYEKEAA